jgi:hypothetical protein
MFATRWWPPGRSGGVDDAFVQQHLAQRSHPRVGSPVPVAEPTRSLTLPGPEQHLPGAASGPLTVASGPSSARRSPSDRGRGRPGLPRSPPISSN